MPNKVLINSNNCISPTMALRSVMGRFTEQRDRRPHTLLQEYISILKAPGILQ